MSALSAHLKVKNSKIVFKVLYPKFIRIFVALAGIAFLHWKLSLWAANIPPLGSEVESVEDSERDKLLVERHVQQQEEHKRQLQEQEQQLLQQMEEEEEEKQRQEKEREQQMEVEGQEQEQKEGGGRGQRDGQPRRGHQVEMQWKESQHVSVRHQHQDNQQALHSALHSGRDEEGGDNGGVVDDSDVERHALIPPLAHRSQNYEGRGVHVPPRGVPKHADSSGSGVHIPLRGIPQQAGSGGVHVPPRGIPEHADSSGSGVHIPPRGIPQQAGSSGVHVPPRGIPEHADSSGGGVHIPPRVIPQQAGSRGVHVQSRGSPKQTESSGGHMQSRAGPKQAERSKKVMAGMNPAPEVDWSGDSNTFLAHTFHYN
eukprot:gene6464-3098_t